MSHAGTALWLLFAGHLVASWGTQWDIQWHLRIGRDSFWIAPHLMTYGGVTALVLVSFGALAWTSWRALGGVRERGTIRVLGITGTPGYHLAAWGIALAVLAAPIDDLWHRLFGLDVTLWSPPHLLGLLGGVLNAAACWVIAREVHPANGRARLAATIVAGAFVAGGLSVSLQPGIRMAYVHGGFRFFTYPMLAALLMPLALVVTARLSRRRTAPVLVLLVMMAIGFAGAGVARAGFAWLQPVSFIAEEIAKDPASPIAVAHELAQKNGSRPGGWNPIALVMTLLAGLAMVALNARRRPVAAALAYALALFVGISVALGRLPAFAPSLPSAPVTIVALAITVMAALVGGRLAGGLATVLERGER